MSEILAPCGAMESLTAAVNAGADAVYLGEEYFSARKNADNFTAEQLCDAVRFCHYSGVKVYVTLNTLVFDREIPLLAKVIENCAKADVDAFIVQDMGVARLSRQIVPELPLHASTQMTVNSPEGAIMAKELGFTRVVLGRELSFAQIKAITESCDIETELFVHGALCVCISGQCYMSSVLGGRSGNRGLCAQPCRLDFTSGDRHNVLSLKDLSLTAALAERSLQDAGFQAEHFVFPHGEQQKNLSTYGQVLNFLCDRRFTRSDFLVALGGGVVGDLAGFAAATYQRGIPYIQVPTTLLSMVDSSVGGKTAVDLDHGKNQAGCFYQPSLVLCDPSLLNTLPEREYRAGCAEIIKYAMLYSEDFLRELEETPVREQFERVISVCVGMKRDVVRDDEFDRGQRALLNLGHTVGHAVEACSGFTLLHGEGVAIGMAIITRAAVEKGLCTPETLPRLLAVLERYGLPTETDYSLTDILAAAEADKKRTDDVTKFIVPERVGHCRVEPVPADEVAGWLKAGGLR